MPKLLKSRKFHLEQLETMRQAEEKLDLFTYRFPTGMRGRHLFGVPIFNNSSGNIQRLSRHIIGIITTKQSDIEIVPYAKAHDYPISSS
ncbi:hypothetical protein M2352_005224 [Azospirillum fermentarium]|uniref:hypothetical protein n=1 Tax=Azospirillum fermentarium TaxID=1233114 RepID=UPI00222645C4|nr:hypothetical protein [Azospirillum fermentarium]MCW2249541.1 hypothetical protein [Azospirillum fermentarium]